MALALRLQLVEEYSKVVDYQHTLANVHVSLGTLLVKKRLVAEAEKHFERGVAILETLAVPGGRTVYQSDLAQALHRQAALLGRRSKPLAFLEAATLVLQPPSGPATTWVVVTWPRRQSLTRAQAGLKRAVAWQQAARKGDPQNTRYPIFLHEHYSALAGMELLLGNHESAARAAGALPEIFPDQARSYLKAAEFLARAIPLAASDTALSLESRPTIVEAYGRKAVRLLEQAVERGFGNPNLLRKAPAFAPLRARSDFRQLLETLEQRKVRTG
jgi:hypothetical protein